MAKQIKAVGFWLFVLVPLAVLTMFAFRPGSARATITTFTGPNWTPAPACGVENCPPCELASVWEEIGGTPGGRGYRIYLHRISGAMRVDGDVGAFAQKLDDLRVAFTYLSDTTGYSQMGYGIVPSFEYRLVKEIDNESEPEGAGGHHVDVYFPGHGMATYTWNSTQYDRCSGCDVYHILSRPSGPTGTYLLTSKHGETVGFDANGFGISAKDRNSNDVNLVYNGSGQTTGGGGNRGEDFSFTHNTNGFLSEFEDECERVWTFEYSDFGNLTSFRTPPTAQQTSGIATTFGYDSSGRMTSITDGRGQTVAEVTYVGGTGQVDTLALDGEDFSMAYFTGRTEMTDRLGNVHRTYFTGTKITQKDMYIGGLSKYATTYTYGGDGLVSAIVFPRGNRIDFDWDSQGNLLERRHKLADTGSTSGSDIVHTWTYDARSLATSYTDPLGNETAYTRDTVGNLTQIDFPDVTSPASQTAAKSFTYNSYGQVTQATDEEGKVTTFAYVTSGAAIHRLASFTVDPSGLALTTSFAYDCYGHLATRTDPRSKTTSFTWDTVGRLLEIQAPSPLSHKIKFEYDENGNPTKKEVENRDKDGNQVSANPWLTTTYTHTPLNDLASMTEEIDTSNTRTFSFDHDANQNLIRVTKPEGNKIKFDYNSRNLLWKVTRGETSGVASTVEYTYDDNGNRTVVKDGRGNETTSTYNLFDWRTVEVNPLGNKWAWSFDRNGNITKVERKDSSNNVLQRREFDFDERDRLWQVSDLHKDPGTTYSDAVTAYARYKTGHVSVVTDARDHDTTFTYDNAWRKTKTTDALGNEMSTTFDAAGNATAWSIKDEDGSNDVTHTYEATYDAVNRRLTKAEIDRTNSSNVLTSTYAYDSRGNLTWLVNAEGNPTRWIYDGLSRMTRKDVALAWSGSIENFTTQVSEQWAFDANDRMTSLKDDAQNTSTWAYDALDRVTSLTYPNSTSVAYTYDANDNATQTLDPAGNDIDDTYDAANRRTARDVTRATGFLDTTAEDFSYDALDRMTLAQDNDYKVEYTYGVLGLSSQVHEERQSYVTGTAYLKTVTRTWDAAGNKATEAYPSGLSLTYAWTNVDALASITDGTNTIASWSYGGLRRKQTDFQNGSKTVLSYTGFRGEVATIHHRDSSNATLLQLDYGYNNLHDRLYERHGSSGSAGDAFAYDKARRLTNAWMGSVTPTTPTTVAYVTKIDYSMDDDGNRTSVVTTPYGQSASTSSYTTNTLNQYTAVGGTSRTHDGNGNVTDDGTFTYVYNYKNLIVKATRKSDSVVVGEYKYDALGRRVEKVVIGATYRFIYSGVETVSVYTSTGAWRQDLVFDETIDGAVMLSQADVLDFDSDSNTSETTRSFYHASALGSVMAITDMNQAVAVSYRYDPYGQVTITRNSATQASDPLGQHVTYTGRWHDEETGVYHYRARTYDPARGVFLQRDPLGYAPGTALYRYCDGDPVRYRDPMGLEKGDWWDPRTWPEAVGEFIVDHGLGVFSGTVPQEIKEPITGAQGLLSVPMQQGLNGALPFLTERATPAISDVSGMSQKAVGGWLTVLQATLGARSGRRGAITKTEAVPGGGTGTHPPAGSSSGSPPKPGTPPARTPEVTPSGGPHAPGDVPDGYPVVRGGAHEPPPSGTPFSGSAGPNTAAAAKGLPHTQIRETTAGDIRCGGGTLEVSPNRVNPWHVNVTEGPGPTSFGPPKPNPVPKDDRPPSKR